MKCEDVEKTVQEYMLLEDKGIIKLLMAFVVALRMPIEPPWLFILGGSSGGKSMVLTAMKKVAGYSALDDLTTNTFMSGMKRTGVETSYLNTLVENSFITFKDFTTVLSMQKEKRQVIVGMLRVIYDGEVNKRTGQGDNLEWNSKVGVLGASTSSFHTKMGEFADMGERIILYQFIQPDSLAVGRFIQQKQKKYSREFVKETMRDTYREYLDNSGFEKFTELPMLDTDLENDLLDLADMTTLARSAVERDLYSRDKRIVFVHFREQPGRFLKELTSIAYGLARINEHDGYGTALTDRDKAILYKLALDSIPMSRRLLMTELTRYGQATIQQLSLRMHLDHDTVKMTLQDMDAHHMLERTPATKGLEFYSLKQRWKDIMMKFQHIKPEQLPEPDPIPTEYIPEFEESNAIPF